MGKCTRWPPTASRWHLRPVGAVDLPSHHRKCRSELSTSSCLERSRIFSGQKFLLRVQTLVSARTFLPRREKSVWCEGLQEIKVHLYLINILFWKSLFIFFCLRTNHLLLLVQMEKKADNKFPRRWVLTNWFDQGLQTTFCVRINQTKGKK